MNIEKQEQVPEKNLSLSIKKNAIWALCSIFLYKLVLDLAYYYVISPVWAYARFGMQLSSLKLAESYILLFIIFIMIPKSSKKLSNILSWLLIILAYVPILTFYAFNDESRIYVYLVTAFWLLVFFLLHITPSFTIKPLKQSKAIRYLLFICLALTVFLLIYAYVGLSFSFSLTNVYDIRSVYVEAGIPLAGYLFQWMALVVNPVFFALFFTKRKWLLVTLIVALQLLLFTTTGNKNYLFALIFVLLLIWIVKRRNPLAYLATMFSIAVLVGMLSYWLVDDLWISSLFTRRTLLIPAQLSFFYYDFFSINGVIYLSHSIFRGFLEYPYSLDPGYLIGQTYFGAPQMNANNGITADAYMNFGLAGLLIWGILVVIILKLVDACSKKVDHRIAIAAIAMPAISLTNGALLTNMLTHGTLLALVLLYLLPKQITKGENE